MTLNKISVLADQAKQVKLEITFTQPVPKPKRTFVFYTHIFKKVGSDTVRLHSSTKDFNTFIKYADADLQLGLYWEYSHTDRKEILI
jgi:hypothetical protein